MGLEKRIDEIEKSKIRLYKKNDDLSRREFDFTIGSTNAAFTHTTAYIMKICNFQTIVNMIIIFNKSNYLLCHFYIKKYF